MNTPQQVRQDEAKGYRRRKARNGYRQLDARIGSGEAVYEKDGTIYIDKAHRGLVEATDEDIYPI